MGIDIGLANTLLNMRYGYHLTALPGMDKRDASQPQKYTIVNTGLHTHAYTYTMHPHMQTWAHLFGEARNSLDQSEVPRLRLICRDSVTSFLGSSQFLILSHADKLDIRGTFLQQLLFPHERMNVKVNYLNCIGLHLLATVLTVKTSSKEKESRRSILDIISYLELNTRNTKISTVSYSCRRKNVFRDTLGH